MRCTYSPRSKRPFPVERSEHAKSNLTTTVFSKNVLLIELFVSSFGVHVDLQISRTPVVIPLSPLPMDSPDDRNDPDKIAPNFVISEAVEDPKSEEVCKKWLEEQWASQIEQDKKRWLEQHYTGDATLTETENTSNLHVSSKQTLDDFNNFRDQSGNGLNISPDTKFTIGETCSDAPNSNASIDSLFGDTPPLDPRDVEEETMEHQNPEGVDPIAIKIIEERGDVQRSTSDTVQSSASQYNVETCRNNSDAPSTEILPNTTYTVMTEITDAVISTSDASLARLDALVRDIREASSGGPVSEPRHISYGPGYRPGIPLAGPTLRPAKEVTTEERFTTIEVTSTEDEVAASPITDPPLNLFQAVKSKPSASNTEIPDDNVPSATSYSSDPPIDSQNISPSFSAARTLLKPPNSSPHANEAWDPDIPLLSIEHYRAISPMSQTEDGESSPTSSSVRDVQFDAEPKGNIINFGGFLIAPPSPIIVSLAQIHHGDEYGKKGKEKGEEREKRKDKEQNASIKNEDENENNEEKVRERIFARKTAKADRVQIIADRAARDVLKWVTREKEAVEAENEALTKLTEAITAQQPAAQARAAENLAKAKANTATVKAKVAEAVKADKEADRVLMEARNAQNRANNRLRDLSETAVPKPPFLPPEPTNTSGPRNALVGDFPETIPPGGAGEGVVRNTDPNVVAPPVVEVSPYVPLYNPPPGRSIDSDYTPWRYGPPGRPKSRTPSPVSPKSTPPPPKPNRKGKKTLWDETGDWVREAPGYELPDTSEVQFTDPFPPGGKKKKRSDPDDYPYKRRDPTASRRRSSSLSVSPRGTNSKKSPKDKGGESRSTTGGRENVARITAPTRTRSPLGDPPSGDPPQDPKGPGKEGEEPSDGTKEPPSGMTEPPGGFQQPLGGTQQPPEETQETPRRTLESSGETQPPPGGTKALPGGIQPQLGETQPPAGGTQEGVPPGGTQQRPGEIQPPPGGAQPPPGATQKPNQGKKRKKTPPRLAAVTSARPAPPPPPPPSRTSRRNRGPLMELDDRGRPITQEAAQNKRLKRG